MPEHLTTLSSPSSSRCNRWIDVGPSEDSSSENSRVSVIYARYEQLGNRTSGRYTGGGGSAQPGKLQASSLTVDHPFYALTTQQQPIASRHRIATKLYPKLQPCPLYNFYFSSVSAIHNCWVAPQRFILAVTACFARTFLARTYHLPHEMPPSCNNTQSELFLHLCPKLYAAQQACGWCGSATSRCGDITLLPRPS